MRKSFLAIFQMLLFISIAYSASNLTIELSTHLGNKNSEITLNYAAENMPSQDVLMVSAIKCDIGHYLHCGRTTGLEKIFVLNKTINSPAGSLSFNLNLGPWFYNICAELEKTVNGEDCTTNYFLLQDNEIIEREVVKYIEPEKEISVSLYNYPEKLKTNQEFEIKANVTNNLNYDINISFYSYVYNSSKLYTAGTWTENKKEATLPAFSTININLKNQIKQDINEGLYNLKLRIKLAEKDFDAVTQVLIADEKPIINISYISMHEKTFDVGIKNSGNSEGSAILLINNNITLIKNIQMNGKLEETFRFPINSSIIDVFLIKKDSIENQRINLIKREVQQSEEPNQTTEEIQLSNKPNQVVNNNIKVIKEDFLTSYAVINEKPFIDYPVLISLIGVVMLLIFLWGVGIGRI